MDDRTQMSNRRDLVRAAVAAGFMVATATAASTFRPVAVVPGDADRFELASMVPERFGEWSIDTTIVPIAPPPDLQQVSENTYDQTLSRTYRDGAGRRVMLSVAYSGRYGKEMQTHRPEVCYPAQGFEVRRVSDTGPLATPFGSVRTTRLVASAGTRVEPITYWLLIGEAQSAFGVDMKLAQLRHAVKGTIADGMLVRVSSIGTDAEREFGLQESFVKDLVGAMSGSARSRIAGLPPTRGDRS